VSTEPDLFTLPARRGRAVRLGAGEAIQIINTHGSQVVDTWMFNAEDLTEFLSNEHMRPTLGKLWPGKGGCVDHEPAARDHGDRGRHLAGTPRHADRGLRQLPLRTPRLHRVSRQLH